MSFKKFASCAIVEAEKITLENWRKNVVSASIKQDPKVVEASPAFDVDESGFVYVRVRAVSAMEHYGPNGNGDAFPEEELQQNYKTFIRRGNYLNHNSEDIATAVGIILDAKYWEEPGTHYVECLLAVDKSEPIADKIAKGIADSVSMGAIVERCHCSVCDKAASCESEYCDHLKNHMGREYNGRKVYAINRGVNFYELSWVSVPADPNAKLLERVASKNEKTETRFDKMVKMADQFQALKEAAPEDAEKPKPKPPTPPKKEDKDFDAIVDNVVNKEVDKSVEHELVVKVRDALKKLKPQQTVQREISDDEILQSVREELAKKTNAPVLPVQSAIHQAVNAKLEAIEKAAEGETIQLTDVYSTLVYGKVAGKAVAQLMKSGNATGLYTLAHGPDVTDSVAYYKEKFSIASTEKNETTEPDNSNPLEDRSVKSNLVIRYIPDASSLDKCAFVARKGNLEVRQIASKLLSDATQKAIVAFEKKEAAGKVEQGVGDYDSTKGKVDVKIEEGKEKAQPSDNTKNLGNVEKGVGDYDATNGKTDNKMDLGKEPIQPSQVVQKYAAQIGGKVTKVEADKKTGVVTAEVEGGSIARLAQLWGSKAVLVKEAMVAGEPMQYSREVPAQVQTDPKDHSLVLARETPEPVKGAAPSGSRGGEQVKYYAGYDKATLTETGDGWAKKVAHLNKELTQVKAEKKMLEAALAKERNEKIAEKKGSLISEIMHRMGEAGALTPDMSEVFELKEKGLEHDDAVVKATALAHDRQKRDLAAMDVAALEQMKKTISRFAVQNTRKSELDTPKSVDVPVVGTDTSSASLEDKLMMGW